jgi:hypothetical protein
MRKRRLCEKVGVRGGMSGKQKSSWAKSAGTALGFIVGGTLILLVQNGLAQSPDRPEAQRQAAEQVAKTR